MKHLIFCLSLSTLLFANGLYAQPFGRHHGMGASHKWISDLTEEQQSAIQELHLQLKKETLVLETKVQTLRTELKLQMVSEKFDEGEVKNLVEQIQKISGNLQMKRLLNRRAVRDLLTAEQRKQFDLHILSGKGPDGRKHQRGMKLHGPPSLAPHSLHGREE